LSINKLETESKRKEYMSESSILESQNVLRSLRKELEMQKKKKEKNKIKRIEKESQESQ